MEKLGEVIKVCHLISSSAFKFNYWRHLSQVTSLIFKYSCLLEILEAAGCTWWSPHLESRRWLCDFQSEHVCVCVLEEQVFPVGSSCVIVLLRITFLKIWKPNKDTCSNKRDTTRSSLSGGFPFIFCEQTRRGSVRPRQDEELPARGRRCAPQRRNQSSAQEVAQGLLKEFRARLLQRICARTCVCKCVRVRSIQWNATNPCSVRKQLWLYLKAWPGKETQTTVCSNIRRAAADYYQIYYCLSARICSHQKIYTLGGKISVTNHLIWRNGEMELPF